MFDQRKRIQIARTVCTRFVREGLATKEHALLVEFKDPQLLQDMQTRNQLKLSPFTNEFQPGAGSFALLPDDDELYTLARTSFLRIVPVLVELFCEQGEGGQYSPDELLEIARGSGQAKDDESELIKMGLYVASDFGILSPLGWSLDGFHVASFGVAKHIVTMEDPLPWWERRVQSTRAESPVFTNGLQGFLGLDGEAFEDEIGGSFSKEGFWALIHPSIREEVAGRFAIREYADAVMAALQVVAQTVRDKTGLHEDGARLMADAFGGDRPYLLFEDPMPLTQRAMQSGYQQLFAGAMTGVRNPKAHSLVTIDRDRCIHFLFLASLLAHKLNEVRVARGEP
jgi:uncharacterized protein (TIGR02391 family)